MEGPLLYIAIFLLSSVSHPLFCASRDKLFPGESISLNETLVSDGGDFAMGFFRIGDSRSNLYLGIWYNNIAQRTIVWVANREKPIKDSSATLKMSNDSNLLIVDSDGGIFWSSNVTSTSSSNSSSAAVLSNMGNLVVREGNNTLLWQSFDHPADNLLPGMKFGFNYKTHKAYKLTSWKGPQDPSPGNFSFGSDPGSSLQFFEWRGSEPYWRSSVLGRGSFSGVQVRNSSSLLYASVIANQDEIFLTYAVSDGSSNYFRFTLDYLGQAQLLIWDHSLRSWRNEWFLLPRGTCDRYGQCGPFGYCDSAESVPTCKCLEGFEPKFQSDWSRGNVSGGCSRKTALECGNRDGFLILGRMKLPDRFLFLKNKTLDECRAECIANCSCNAYAYNILSVGSRNASRCLVWMEDLIDAGMVGSGAENLYLRLSGSELGTFRSCSIYYHLTLILFHFLAARMTF